MPIQKFCGEGCSKNIYFTRRNRFQNSDLTECIQFGEIWCVSAADKLSWNSSSLCFILQIKQGTLYFLRKVVFFSEIPQSLLRAFKISKAAPEFKCFLCGNFSSNRFIDFIEFIHRIRTVLLKVSKWKHRAIFELDQEKQFLLILCCYHMGSSGKFPPLFRDVEKQGGRNFPEKSKSPKFSACGGLHNMILGIL